MGISEMKDMEKWRYGNKMNIERSEEDKKKIRK